MSSSAEFEIKRLAARLKMNKLYKRLEKWHDGYIKMQNKHLKPTNQSNQIIDPIVNIMWKDGMKRIDSWYLKMSRGELMEDWEMVAANNLWLSYKPNTKATDCSAVKSA